MADNTLAGQVRRGMGWKAASQILRQLTRLAVIVVLARELTPAEYGLAGMVLVFSTLVLVFADLALGAALVQRDKLTEQDRSTVFWASAGAGLCFTILAYAGAGVVAGFFDAPDVKPLLQAFSLTFVLTSLGTIQFALLTRELAFRQLELRAMAASMIGAVTGITLAVNGAGAWAIIGQQLAIAGVSTTLLWITCPWHPRLMFSWTRLRDLGGFGLRVFGTRVVFYLERNVDTVLVARFLGPAATGLYTLSYNVMLVPLEQIGGPMAEVLFPAFSKMQDDLARLRAAWLRAVRVLAAIVAPAMALLIALAPDIIPVVFGEKWKSAVPIVQLLAFVGLQQSLMRFNSSVLQAVGRADFLLRYALISATVCISGFAVGLHWGVTGVAVSYTITATLVAPVYLVFTTRSIDMRVREFLTNVAGIMGAAVIVALLAALARVGLESAVPQAAVRLILILPVSAVLYVLLALRFSPSLADDVMSVMPASVKGRMLRLRPALRPAGDAT